MTKAEIAEQLEYYEIKIQRLKDVVLSPVEDVGLTIDIDNRNDATESLETISIDKTEWLELKEDLIKALNKACERLRREMHSALYPDLPKELHTPKTEVI